MKRLYIVAVIITSLIGCSTAPKYEPSPKQAEMGQFYFYRLSAFTNSGAYAVIRINGEKVVTLKSGGYASVQLEPGNHELAVHGVGALAPENKTPFCRWDLQISSSDVRYFKWDGVRTHYSFGPFQCSEVGTFVSSEVALKEIVNTSLLPVETPIITVIAE